LEDNVLPFVPEGEVFVSLDRGTVTFCYIIFSLTMKRLYGIFSLEMKTIIEGASR